MPATTTTTAEEREEARLIAAVRTAEARLAALGAGSPEADRCAAEARLARARLEALYRRWPGRRGTLVAAAC